MHARVDRSVVDDSVVGLGYAGEETRVGVEAGVEETSCFCAVEGGDVGFEGLGEGAVAVEEARAAAAEAGGGEEVERWERKEVWREWEEERERKSLEEKSTLVLGVRVRRRREDFVARWERCRRIAVVRASGGSAMLGRGIMGWTWVIGNGET